MSTRNTRNAGNCSEMFKVVKVEHMREISTPSLVQCAMFKCPNVQPIKIKRK